MTLVKNNGICQASLRNLDKLKLAFTGKSEKGNVMSDNEFLNMQIDGCSWEEIKEMFWADADSLTKQVYYFDKYYQCEFLGSRCTGTYILN